MAVAHSAMKKSREFGVDKILRMAYLFYRL